MNSDGVGVADVADEVEDVLTAGGADERIGVVNTDDVGGMTTVL